MATGTRRRAAALAVTALVLAPLPAVADRAPYDVTVAVSPVEIPPGGRLTLTATVSPAVVGEVATIRERLGEGEWQVVARPAVGVGGRVTVRLGRRSEVGAHEFQVLAPGQLGLVQTGAVAVSRVTVTGRGSRSSWSPLYGSRAEPYLWSSCTLHYQVNPRRRPAKGLADLREALRRAGQVSGVRFVFDGRTTVVPDVGYQGPGMNRFVVAWAGPGRSRLLDSATAGRAGTFGDATRLHTGFLLFNTRWTSRAPSGFGSGQPNGAVMMHEVGHLLGLGHTADRHQIMHPVAPHPAAVWGAGDLTGLRRVGRAMGCRP
jgi:hypothetical protein